VEGKVVLKDFLSIRQSVKEMWDVLQVTHEGLG